MAEPLKVLIVDQNKVYASMVKEILHKHASASVDIAVNVFELKRKLAERKYTLVIADVAATEEEMEITEAITDSGVPVIAWTSVAGRRKCKSSDTKEIRKPSSVEEMRRVIPSILTDGNCR